MADSNLRDDLPANKFAFTKRRLADLEPPASGRLAVYDLRRPGLMLRVTPSGTRTFYFVGRLNGRLRYIALGEFPDTTIEQARGAVKDLPRNKAMMLGSGRGAMTFRQLFCDWLDNYAKENKRTWQEDQRKYDKHLQPWARRRLTAITKRDVVNLHRDVGNANGRVIANRLLSLVKTVFSWAVTEEHIVFDGPSPAAAVKKFAEEDRDRFLGPDELHRFFAALDVESPQWRDFFLLCLFTGARRGNVSSMRWAEVDLRLAVWHIPPGKTKTKKPYDIPLDVEAITILSRRLDEQRESGVIHEYVFPAKNKQGHVAEFRKPWARITANANIEDLHIHDLRRSLGSWQTITGASTAVVGKTLGHADPRATAVYARLNLDPVRESIRLAIQSMRGARS